MSIHVKTPIQHLARGNKHFKKWQLIIIKKAAIVFGNSNPKMHCDFLVKTSLLQEIRLNPVNYFPT